MRESFSVTIKRIREMVQQEIATQERSEKTRLLAIVNTNLETAELFAEKAGD